MFFSCGKAAVWLSIQSSFFTKKINTHKENKEMRKIVKKNIN